MTELSRMLDTALEHHRARRFHQAELLYRQILAADPNHAQASRLLGLIAHEAGKQADAVRLIERAIILQPDDAAGHMSLGLILAGQGDQEQAISCFRRATELAPDQAEAHNNLGACLNQRGRGAEALVAFRTAVELRPDFSAARLNLARTLEHLGKLDAACAEYREVLRRQPQTLDARFLLGQALRTLGRPDEEAALLREALAHCPANAEANNELGLAFAKAGRMEEAETCFRTALGFRPEHAAAAGNLGNVLRRRGDLAGAEQSFRQAARCDLGDPIPRVNLGTLLLQQGRTAEALQSLQEAAHVGPNCAEAFLHLGHLLGELGRGPEAISALRRPADLRPGDPVIPNEIGNLLQDAGSHEDAEVAYRRSVAADAAFAPAFGNLGFLLADQGRVAEAQENYARAEQLHPSPRLRLVAGVMLPPVYRSAEEMAAWRSRLTANLQRFQDEGLRVDATLETMPTLFYSAYHGKNDRELQVALASLGKGKQYEPRASRARSAKGRIHIGFLSSYLKDHTIGRLNVGLITHLPRDQFHVTVLTVGQPNDSLAGRIRASADRAVALPAAVPAALDVVISQGLDILFYTDIGMNPFTYTLAFNRLAPVQCVTWGHPVTTGLPTMDYFISSVDLETEESAEQYTEQLVRLSRLSVYYERPILVEAKRRPALGLPEGAHLYACPQTLFKFHPDFDAVLAEILRRDPKGLLVVLESKYATWRDLLTERWRRTCADVFDRMRFLPRLHHEDYLHLLAASDVLLDPLHFGGGNSSYEGLALGTPVVTLPSRYLRGRITYAQLRQMGLLETVVQTPEAYIELAVALGTERDRRQAVREKILTANEVLFEDRQAVTELAEFLQRAGS